MKLMEYFKQLSNKRMAAVLLFSFASGLPLALTTGTLQAWYTVAGVNIVAIGALSLVGQPYVFKFLWAPIMDRYRLFGLDRRRGWILLAQFLLVVGFIVMALLNPGGHALILAFAALAVATFSASQDIAIDAYRTDISMDHERGTAASLNTLGYRFAMVISGALALIMAQAIGFRSTYLIMAGLMGVQMLITVWAPRPIAIQNVPTTMRQAVIWPWQEFMSRKNIILILIFIVIYKLCDAFALSLTTPFFIRGIGFSLAQVGTVAKSVGLFASLFGVGVAGIIMPRIGLFNSLFYFGILQAVSNLAFMVQALVGKSLWVMGLSVFSENFCGGLSTVAFVAFLMAMCDRRFTATQFALLSALSAVGRVFVGPFAGVMVEHMGWAVFYFLTFLIGIPALLLLQWLRGKDYFSQNMFKAG